MNDVSERKISTSSSASERINVEKKNCYHTRSASKPYCDICDPLHEWLPIHNRKMVSRERERIIALVREMPRVAHDGLVNAEQLIALIKGENSE